MTDTDLRFIVSFQLTWVRVMFNRNSLSKIVCRSARQGLMFGLAALILAGMTAVSLAQTSSEKSAEPAMKVGDITISKEQFKKGVEQRMQRLKKRMPKGSSKAKRIRRIAKMRHKRELEAKLLVEYHSDKASVSVSDSELKNEWNERKKNWPSQKKKRKSDQSFEQLWKERGRTQDPKKNLKVYLRVQKYLDKNLETKKVTEKQVRDLYKKHKKKHFKGKTFDDVKGRLRQHLENQERRKAVQKLIKKLKKKTDMQINV